MKKFKLDNRVGIRAAIIIAIATILASLINTCKRESHPIEINLIQPIDTLQYSEPMYAKFEPKSFRVQEDHFWTHLRNIPVKDRKGEVDTITISYVFPFRAHWVRNEFNLAVDERTNTKKHIGEIIRTPLIEEIVLKSANLVCLGNSSHEENSSIDSQTARIQFEEDRAFERAESLAKWIRSILAKNDPRPVCLLNIGKSLQTLPKGENSDFQRAIVVISVKNNNPDIALGEALYSALEYHTEIKLLPFDFRLYSKVSEKNLQLGPCL